MGRTGKSIPKGESNNSEKKSCHAVIQSENARTPTVVSRGKEEDSARLRKTRGGGGVGFCPGEKNERDSEE